MAKEIYGFDLDGVLVEIIKPLLIYYNLRFNTTFKREDIKQFNLYKTWGGTPERDQVIIRDFYRSEYFKEVKPCPHAVEGINQLDGPKVIITSRPEDIRENTLECLDRFFRNKFEEVYFSNDFFGLGVHSKVELCKKLGIRKFTEDSLESSLQLAQQGIRAYLIDSPWNQSAETFENIERVKDWPELVPRLKR